MDWQIAMGVVVFDCEAGKFTTEARSHGEEFCIVGSSSLASLRTLSEVSLFQIPSDSRLDWGNLNQDVLISEEFASSFYSASPRLCASLRHYIQIQRAETLGRREEETGLQKNETADTEN